MAEFDFTLILSGISDVTDDQADSLFASGCDDATIAQRYGRVYMTFSREAETMAQAIISAIEDVRRAGLDDVSVMRVDTCNLVTQAEIARRIDRSRQAVSQYISGERGPGSFPPPACNIVEGQPLWYWCEVAYWLSQNDLIKGNENREAQEIAAINAILELEQYKTFSLEATEHFLWNSGLCECPDIKAEREESADSPEELQDA